MATTHIEAFSFPDLVRETQEREQMGFVMLPVTKPAQPCSQHKALLSYFPQASISTSVLTSCMPCSLILLAPPSSRKAVQLASKDAFCFTMLQQMPCKD